MWGFYCYDGWVRKPTKAGMRNKADKLLTPIIKKMHPQCLLCGGETQVAHHHVHKSKSTRLRYEIDNLIPLCHECHIRLHMNESFWASKIVTIKGMDWFRRVEKMGQEIVKADIHWYKDNFERLTEILNKL